eukprot:1286460-Alexandrium_andersonii.AAC.1
MCIRDSSPTVLSSSPRHTRSSRVFSWPSRRTPTSATPAGGNSSVAQVAARARQDALEVALGNQGR